MSGSKDFIEPLQEVLRSLSAAIGASYTPEEAAITIQLSYDRGMRMQRLLRERCPEDASDEYRRQLDTLPTSYHGRYIHEMQIAGVRFEWPARVIHHGDGRQSYV